MKRSFINHLCEALLGLATAAVGILLIWLSAAITDARASERPGVPGSAAPESVQNSALNS